MICPTPEECQTSLGRPLCVVQPSKRGGTRAGFATDATVGRARTRGRPPGGKAAPAPTRSHTPQGYTRIALRGSFGRCYPLSAFDAGGVQGSNILLNATDAAGPNGTITVTARAIELPVPSISIAVHDTGPGIAADTLGRIWEPYVTTKPGGTGLGLAIVRQTILAHGGSVDATSAPGRGTTITLTLPRICGSKNSRAAS